MIKDNKRITPRDRGLIKGAIRRVFSRSELRKEALKLASITHSDLGRPRVKKWSLCPLCNVKTPQYLMQVDHINPIVPVNSTPEDLTWDYLINATWCDLSLLQAICKECHLLKTKEERKMRVRRKKSNEQSN